LKINAGLRLRPAFYEMARAFENAESFPTQRFVPLEGAATGFFISPDGYFLTTYHVVREEIEAAGRTSGGIDPLACRYLSFEVPEIDDKGRVAGYRLLTNVKLVRNLSAKVRDEGYDAVLLKADIESPAYLEMATTGPVANENIWTMGFPIRTERDAERLRAVGYTDADGSLRITTGKITEINNPEFRSTADGLSGTSGAPTLNKEGRVVGIVRDMYPKNEENRRAVAFSGGLLHLDIRAANTRLGLQGVLNQASK
jgi:S1-C subfamily serine protease